MSHLIIAIALWCQAPYDGRYTGGSTEKEQKCREELLACTLKDKNGNGMMDCFKNKKLN